MKIAMIIIRTLMGALLLFSSANFFFKLVPAPVMPAEAITYNQGLAVVNLMLFVKVIEILCGLAFITGRFVALAAVVFFPIALNIVLFHAVVMPATIGGGLFTLIGDIFLAIYYRQKYAPMLTAK